MTVHFIGAGPGDPGLITVRGAELLACCPVVIHAGSLVPRSVIARAARALDSSGMTLDEIVREMAAAHRAGEDVARVHSGDPCLFGSIAEQMRRLDALGIPYAVVPGVSSFTAAAAALRRELTVPGVSQIVIIARAPGRTPVPERQRLEELARHGATLGATLALFLSAGLVEEAVEALLPAYGPGCPAAVVHRASWPDERILRGTLSTIAAQMSVAGIHATAMILVGAALAPAGFPDSRLYAPEFGHGFRAGLLAASEEDRPAEHELVPHTVAGSSSSRAARRRNGTACTLPPRGLLVVYTGDGKGKTTAALGLVFRALGRGLPVAVVQFIKGKWKTGERLFAATLPELTFLTMGEGFTWVKDRVNDEEDDSEGDDSDAHGRAARIAWKRARDLLAAGAHRIVVLDELTHAVRHGFVPIADVLAALAARPAGVTAVVTGRGAPSELVEAADLVTEMRSVKHPFDRGDRALPGVDF
jgi:precorrin-4/cobalt-precorrin-4 C11-methyltransferase